MRTSRPPHSCDLRKGRFSQLGQVYLVTTRCNRRKKLFSDLRLGQIVIDEIHHSDLVVNTKTLAFVVMPDHLHWLLELRDSKSLSHTVKQLKGRAARRINLSRQQTRIVWQSGFHDRAIRHMQDLRELGLYIANNPVRAGLVSHYTEYSMLHVSWL